MFKYVVALATRSGSDRAVAATAARALDPASSHIAFVHVRMDVEQMMLRMAGGGLAIAGSITDLQQKANDTERRARENFQAACSELSMTTGDAPGPGVSASWTMGIGEEAEELATFGRASDAVVLSRKRDTPLGALDVLEAALLETGRPILIAPTNPPAYTAQASSDCLEEHARGRPRRLGGDSAYRPRRGGRDFLRCGSESRRGPVGPTPAKGPGMAQQAGQVAVSRARVARRRRDFDEGGERGGSSCLAAGDGRL